MNGLVAVGYRTLVDALLLADQRPIALDVTAQFSRIHESIRLPLLAACLHVVETMPSGLGTHELERHIRTRLADLRADPRWVPTAPALDHPALQDGEVLRFLLGTLVAGRELDAFNGRAA